MSKFGVGVGEEFPVDEEPRAKTQQEDVPDNERFCGHDFREARRRAWRKFRHQMHEEWHARRRAFRDSFNQRDGVEAIHDVRHRHVHHLIVGGLAMIGLAALLGVLRHRD
jgi:hypothetical protein